MKRRDFKYLLHHVTVKEKDDIMSSLWGQHIEEMKMLEGNILTFSQVLICRGQQIS